MMSLKRILSVLMICAFMLATLPAFAHGAAPAAGGVSFGGYAVHDFAYDINNKFVTFSGDDPEQCDSQCACLTTYAAAYYDGIVYGYLYGYDINEVLHDEFYTVDTRNGHIINFAGGSSAGEFVYAMAYNYADGNMYALCDEDNPYIATVDLKTGDLSRVVDIDLGSFLGLRGMAISPSGEFYALSMSAVNARLLTVDMQTGELSAVAATGLPAYYAQSMTFDPATGTLYWAQLEDSSDNGLYSVDTETAECTFMGKIGGAGMEITGLYVVYDGEPQPPEFIPGDADCSGEISISDALLALRFTMGTAQLSEQGTLAADMNGNGFVTATDALEILRLAMGIAL